MKLIHAILAGLVVTALMVIWVATTPAPEMAAGAAHPDYPAMTIGGDGTRASPILLPAWLWQAAVIITATLLILLGIAPRHRSGMVLGLLAACGLAMLVSWTFLLTSYQASVAAGETSYALGFPVATSWMIYGIWFSQGLLTVLYCWGFRKFIFTEEDEAKFEAIAARARAEKAAGQEPGGA